MAQFPSVVLREAGEDVTALLQKVIGEAAGGEPLVLPYGMYYVSSPVHVPSGVHVVGHGATIRAAVGAWASTGGYEPLLRVQGDNVILEGITLDGQGSVRTAGGDTVAALVLVTNSSNVVLRQVTFLDQGHTIGSPTTPHLEAVANDDLVSVFVDRGDGSAFGEVGGVTGLIVDGCTFEAGNQNFAIRCESNWTEEQDPADFVHHVENVVVRDCTFTGEFAWNTVEFAGGGTRDFLVENCFIDGKALTWLDADKGCYRGTFRGNHCVNGGKPARYSAVLLDTSAATGANSLTATAPLVAHAYDGMKLVSSAGVSYTITSNTTSVFTLAASGATPASGAYHVGPALSVTTRLTCVDVHGSSGTYHTRDVQILDNFLEDAVTVNWTDAYESFLGCQSADDVVFRGNHLRSLNNGTTQGYAAMNHGDTSGVTVEGNVASSIAQGIGTNLNNTSYTNFVVRNNHLDCALACLTFGSADSAGTQAGLVIEGNWLRDADTVGTLAVNLTPVWLRSVVSRNYVVGGLVGYTFQSATGTALGNVADGAATGFDYHAGSTTMAIGNQSLNCGAVMIGAGTINGAFNS